MTRARGLRRWSGGFWLSHVAAFCVGLAVAAFAGRRALATGYSVGRAFVGEPLGHAAAFAFAWGSDPESEVTDLCRAAPGCIPEKLPALIAKLAAGRKVGGTP